MNMKVYAFDVDETLYLSHGPVQWEALVALRAEGHVLGLCGNWAAVTMQVPEWHRVLSFIGPSLIGTDKANFLATIKQNVPAEEHVMVGNDHSLRAYASPDDRHAADAAGWRFLSEAPLRRGADDWLFVIRDGGLSLRRGIGVFNVARNMGTSVQIIQGYYGRHATPRKLATQLGG
jgi:hypothetical protein